MGVWLRRAALYVFHLAGGAWVVRGLRRALCPPSIRILFAHRVWDDGALRGLTRAAFARRVRLLARRYRVISLAEAVRQLRSGEVEGWDQVVITFDDGYEDNYRNARPVLEAYGAPATFFLTTGALDEGRPPWPARVRLALEAAEAEEVRLTWLPGAIALGSAQARREAGDRLVAALRGLPAQERRGRVEELLGALSGDGGDGAGVGGPPGLMLTWEQAREMCGRGLFAAGSHTVSHPVLSATPAEEARGEVLAAAERIQEVIQERPGLFAYPSGQSGDFGEEHAAMVREAGHVCACTTEPGTNQAGCDLYRLKREPIPGNEPFHMFALRVAGLPEVGERLGKIARALGDRLRGARGALVVALGAVVLRAVWALVVPARPMSGDEVVYDRLARSLLAGEGFSYEGAPTAGWAPLYPTAVAAVYALSGGSGMAVKLAQALLEGVSALLVYAIAREITGRRAIALLGGGMYALYPPAIAAAGRLLTETLATALVLASCYLLLRAARGGEARRLVGAGLALGAGALTRGVVLGAVVVVPGVLPGWGVRRAAAGFGWAALGVALLVGPWTARNHRLFGSVIPVQAQLGESLFRGSFGNADISNNQDPRLPEVVRRTAAGPSRERADGELTREALRYIRQRPGPVAALAARKVLRLWFSVGWGRPPTARALLRCAVMSALVGLAVVMWVWGDRGWRRPAAAPVGFLAYFTAAHAALYAVPRYVLPVEPLLLVLASAGAWTLGARARRRVEGARLAEAAR